MSLTLSMYAEKIPPICRKINIWTILPHPARSPPLGGRVEASIIGEVRSSDGCCYYIHWLGHGLNNHLVYDNLAACGLNYTPHLTVKSYYHRHWMTMS
jgi:hypothetical protein